MSSPHKKTIFNVLILYLSSSLLLVFVLAYSYYDHQKMQLQTEEQKDMELKAKKLYNELQTLHNQHKNPSIYPRYKEYNSAIYDIDHNLLFSTLQNKTIEFQDNYYQKGSYSYYIYEMKPYYMGAAFIVIEQQSRSVCQELGFSILYITIAVVLLILFTSLFLVRLLLKPLQQNAQLLDRFIKDTTHELNTPVATILTNIEMLENFELENKVSKKINRIKMASLTISNLYEDLVFLVLNHKTSSQNEILNINEIIKDRLSYFELLITAKNLKIDFIQNNHLVSTIDKKKITRVIDNLLSNAIKYTNDDTQITVTIDKNFFSIKDEGDGMTKEEIAQIFERYTRFDTTKGGFGLGYNIVYTIVKEYNLDITIDSIKNGGTCVTLKF